MMGLWVGQMNGLYMEEKPSENGWGWKSCFPHGYTLCEEKRFVAWGGHKFKTN